MSTKHEYGWDYDAQIHAKLTFHQYAFTGRAVIHSPLAQHRNRATNNQQWTLG